MVKELMRILRKNNLMIYFIITTCYLSCSNNEISTTFYKGDTLVLNRIYKNGNIEKEETFNMDSVNQGYIKFFYPNGQLKIMVEYVKGKKHGKSIAYFPNGKLEHEGLYNQGKQDSVWIWYYKEGTVQAKDSWMNGVQFGVQYKYNSNNASKKFFFCGIDGAVLYERIYDNGKFISESGKNLNIFHNTQNLTVNDTFECVNIIGNPPGTLCYLDLIMKDNKGNIISNEKVNYRDLEKRYFGNRYTYKFNMDKSGRYKFLSILSTNDTVNYSFKKDTSALELVVKKIQPPSLGR